MLPLSPVGIFVPALLSLLVVGAYAVPVGDRMWVGPQPCLGVLGGSRPVGG